MRYHDDKHGSKLVFFFIVIVFVYLACFNFNIGNAYRFALQGLQGTFSSL